MLKKSIFHLFVYDCLFTMYLRLVIELQAFAAPLASYLLEQYDSPLSPRETGLN